MGRSFTGSPQEVTFAGLPDFNGAAGMTLGMWYKPTGPGDTIVGVKYTVWNVRQNIFNTNSIMWQCGFNGTEYGYTDANSYPLNAWCYLGVRYDGTGTGNAGRLKIYRNDMFTPLHLTFNSTIPAVLGSDSRVLRIGNGEGGPVYGQFDFAYMKLWNVTLTEKQLDAEKNSRKMVTMTGKQAWVPGDEGGNVINDYAGIMTNGNPGRVGVPVGSPPSVPPPPVSAGGSSGRNLIV